MQDKVKIEKINEFLTDETKCPENLKDLRSEMLLKEQELKSINDNMQKLSVRQTELVGIMNYIAEKMMALVPEENGENGENGETEEVQEND